VTVPASSESGSSFQLVTGQRRAYAAGAAVLAIGVLCGSLLYRDALSRSREAFRQRAGAIAAAIRANLTPPIESVRTIPPYFAASGLVEAEEFRVYVQPMLAMNPSVVLVGFAPRVGDAERAEVEQQARASGFPAFAVRERYADGTLGPSRPRSNYIPVLYCEPQCGDSVGVDLGSNHTLDTESAARALERGEITLAPSTSLIRDSPSRSTVAVFAPLASRPLASTDPRIPRPGLAVVVVDVERAIAPALDRAARDSMRIELVDGDAPSDRIFLSTPRDRRTDEASTSFVDRFRIHNRNAVLRFTPAEGTITAGPMPAIVATCAVLLAILTTLAMLLAQNARRFRAAMRSSRELGPYRLIRRIGQGGMGTVYQAEHALLRRPTAVKVISDDRDSKGALERFEREAKLTSQLTHPNTIVVFDYGRTADGVFYYAMEYLRGFTIDDIVKTGGPQPPARVVHILRQIAGSLAEAHASGLVHRDVKPANVMICKRGGIHDFVKVLDFGLVKDIFGQEVMSLSVAGQTLGTPRYMAPETFVDCERPTPAADVYAVGAIGYYLLTGHEMIEGPTMAAILAHHVSGVSIPPSVRVGEASTIPPELDELILRCLSRDKSARPRDGEELLRALDRCGVAAWTEDDARRAQIGHDERFDEASSDFSGDDTLALDVRAREHSGHTGGDGDHGGHHGGHHGGNRAA